MLALILHFVLVSITIFSGSSSLTHGLFQMVDDSNYSPVKLNSGPSAFGRLLFEHPVMKAMNNRRLPEHEKEGHLKIKIKEITPRGVRVQTYTRQIKGEDNVSEDHTTSYQTSNSLANKMDSKHSVAVSVTSDARTVIPFGNEMPENRPELKQAEHEANRTPTVILIRSFPANVWSAATPDISPTAADVSPTSADVSPTAADVSPTAADVSLTAADVSPTGADVSPTGADVSPTGADVFPTGADVFPTGADVSPTGADVSPTGADVSPTGANVSPTGADASQTARMENVFVKSPSETDDMGHWQTRVLSRLNSNSVVDAVTGVYDRFRSFFGTEKN